MKSMIGECLGADFILGRIRMFDSYAEMDHCLDDCNPVESRMAVKHKLPRRCDDAFRTVC